MRKILYVIMIALLLSSCSAIEDQTYKGENIQISDIDIGDERKMFMTTGVYETMEDMYNDADVVIKGYVENIVYYTDDGILLNEAMIVNVRKVYKGELSKNVLISVYTYRKCIDKEKLYSESSKSDGIIELPRDTKYFTTGSLVKSNNDNVGKECILFLVNGGEDIFSHKKIQNTFRSLPIVQPVVIPKEAYMPLGITMGVFILNDENKYVRQSEYYYHDIDLFIKRSQDAQETKTDLVYSSSDYVLAVLEGEYDKKDLLLRLERIKGNN